MIGTIPATLLYHKSPTHGVPSCYIKFQRFTWLSDHKKKKKSLMGEKEEKSFSHFQVASSTEKRWMNLLQFLVCEKSEPKRELLQKFAYYHSTSISYCYVAICLHEIHKTLNFVKEESFKILILTSFCRDPTDINPLLILIQDLCIFFQAISMT